MSTCNWVKFNHGATLRCLGGGQRSPWASTLPFAFRLLSLSDRGFVSDELTATLLLSPGVFRASVSLPPGSRAFKRSSNPTPVLWRTQEDKYQKQTKHLKVILILNKSLRLCGGSRCRCSGGEVPVGPGTRQPGPPSPAPVTIIWNILLFFLERRGEAASVFRVRRVPCSCFPGDAAEICQSEKGITEGLAVWCRPVWHAGKGAVGTKPRPRLKDLSAISPALGSIPVVHGWNLSAPPRISYCVISNVSKNYSLNVSFTC